MKKIKTLEGLGDAISEEVYWRKRELTNSKKLVQCSSERQTVHLRAGVLLLYAHWEGWVKNISQLYVRFVRTQGLTYEELSEAFLGNAIKTKLAAIGVANKAQVHNEFVQFIRTRMSDSASLSENLVNTESNLSSVVFLDILSRLGISHRTEYTTKSHQIDEGLVSRRNTIAHGQHVIITHADYLRLHDDIVALLTLFTDDVLNAATLQTYLDCG